MVKEKGQEQDGEQKEMRACVRSERGVVRQALTVSTLSAASSRAIRAHTRTHAHTHKHTHTCALRLSSPLFQSQPVLPDRSFELDKDTIGPTIRLATPHPLGGVTHLQLCLSRRPCE
jgi:hypothetical protein